MLSEFKKFATQGNVMDLAVGVIIGGAFGKIIASLVGDIAYAADRPHFGRCKFQRSRRYRRRCICQIRRLHPGYNRFHHHCLCDIHAGESR